MSMGLYLVKRIGPVSWDENAGFVIAAYSYKDAISYAADAAGDEGRRVWEDDTKSTCELIASDVSHTIEEGVVLTDFRAG